MVRDPRSHPCLKTGLKNYTRAPYLTTVIRRVINLAFFFVMRAVSEGESAFPLANEVRFLKVKFLFSFHFRG